MRLENEHEENSVTEAAARSPVIQHFSIEGLFGYRSLSLESKHAATILIAKNGSGKSTLLGALDAFLLGQFTRFAGLTFTVIRCRLAGVPDELILRQLDVEQLLRISEDGEFLNFAKLHEVDATALLDYTLDDSWRGSNRDAMDNPIFHKLYQKSGYNPTKARALLEKLSSDLAAKIPHVDKLRKKIRTALNGIEVVYLPTFRRIELSLPDQEDPRTGRRKLSMLARLGLSKKGLFAADMQFGLADISDRLAKLHQEMLFLSNQGYREISANIIKDLITGEFDRENPSLDQRPSPEALKLFFHRVEEGRQLVPYESLQMPDVAQIYGNTNITESSSKFLTYFLGKLNSVMKKTRGVEEVVEEFIKNCNRYLSAEDDSASIKKKRRSIANNDDKMLKLDRRSLKVSVSSVATGREIPLDALSSGEKQMISLFARLYLYPGNKIVLIDEPELSLSLDWQRKILVDIVTAPSCSQVVAITHSPFVFDNELDEFATSLKLRFDLVAPLFDEEGDVNG